MRTENFKPKLTKRVVYNCQYKLFRVKGKRESKTIMKKPIAIRLQTR